MPQSWYCRHCGKTLLYDHNDEKKCYNVGHPGLGPDFTLADTALQPAPDTIWDLVREEIESVHWNKAFRESKSGTVIDIKVKSETSGGKTTYSLALEEDDDLLFLIANPFGWFTCSGSTIITRSIQYDVI